MYLIGVSTTMQQEVTILFPLHTNDGRSLEVKVAELVRQVCLVSGGVATYEQQGIEVWDDGNVYHDTSLRTVTIVDCETKVKLLRSIALRAIEELEQRGGIFFQVTNTQVEFLSRDDCTAHELTELVSA